MITEIDQCKIIQIEILRVNLIEKGYKMGSKVKV